jgi:hypothetical protein
MVDVRKDYAASTGLKLCLGCGSTQMPRRRRWRCVVSALCADAFEPQARRYNRIP